MGLTCTYGGQKVVLRCDVCKRLTDKLVKVEGVWLRPGSKREVSMTVWACVTCARESGGDQ